MKNPQFIIVVGVIRTYLNADDTRDYGKVRVSVRGLGSGSVCDYALFLFGGDEHDEFLSRNLDFRFGRSEGGAEGCVRGGVGI